MNLKLNGMLLDSKWVSREADAYETSEATDPQTGRRFVVEWRYDPEHAAPWAGSDPICVGWLTFDPKTFRQEDIDCLHDLPHDAPEVMEQIARHQLMRVLHVNQRMYGAGREYLVLDVYNTIQRLRAGGGKPLGDMDATIDGIEDMCRGWAKDEWHYCGITVTPLTKPHEQDDPEDSPQMLHEYADTLWGLESNDSAYHTEVIADMMRCASLCIERDRVKEMNDADPTFDAVAAFDTQATT